MKHYYSNRICKSAETFFIIFLLQLQRKKSNSACSLRARIFCITRKDNAYACAAISRNAINGFSENGNFLSRLLSFDDLDFLLRKQLI